MFGVSGADLGLGRLRGLVEVDLTTGSGRVDEVVSYCCYIKVSSHPDVSINAALEGFEFLIDAA